MRRLFLGLAIASIATLSPCWALADDQQIAQQIVQQLRQHKAEGRLNGFGIDLEVEGGIVWLKGHVTSQEQQALVLDVTRQVAGVTQVVNDLSIKAAPPATAAPKAAKKPGQLLTHLNRNVQRAFRAEKPAAAPRAASQPTQAVAAQPTPAVAAQPTPAVAAAQPAPRQEPVRPTVQTVPVAESRPALPSDEQLAEEVIGRLRSQKERGTLRHFDVDVQVDDRVVWVTGRVASEEQQALVLDVARRVRGVKQVVNDLQVASTAPVQVVSAPVAPAAPAMVPPAQMPVPMVAAAGQPVMPAPLPYAPAPALPQVPLAMGPAQSVAYNQPYVQQMVGQPMPEVPAAGAVARARFDHPTMPGYAWPSYAAYPNYAAVTYPRQYSPTAWPYIGPFYPYPQVPLGWRKVTMEWDDGWWWLDFKSK